MNSNKNLTTYYCDRSYDILSIQSRITTTITTSYFDFQLLQLPLLPTTTTTITTGEQHLHHLLLLLLLLLHLHLLLLSLRTYLPNDLITAYSVVDIFFHLFEVFHIYHRPIPEISTVYFNKRIILLLMN